MNHIEVMKQALEALEYHAEQTRPLFKTDHAIVALTEAIAEAESTPVQEPVGYEYGNSYWDAANPRITDDVKRFGSPRYATPQERRDAGHWHCPECYTFGHQHRRGCSFATKGGAA